MLIVAFPFFSSAQLSKLFLFINAWLIELALPPFKPAVINTAPSLISFLAFLAITVE